MDIAEVPNVGPTSAEWLRSVGVATRADLERVGPAAAFLAVRSAGRRPSLNLLWALAAGLRGEHWATLSAPEKGRLRQELADLEA